jgi:hypothetical protein
MSGREAPGCEHTRVGLLRRSGRAHLSAGSVQRCRVVATLPAPIGTTVRLGIFAALVLHPGVRNVCSGCGVGLPISGCQVAGFHSPGWSPWWVKGLLVLGAAWGGSMDSIRRRRGWVLGLAWALAVIGAVASSVEPAAGSSAAKATTLHLYSKSIVATFFHADGQAITSLTTLPSPGDYFIATFVDYVGNHNKHARRSTGSHNFSCTMSANTTAICDGALAVGGSLVLVNHVTVSLADATGSFTIAITGGTGKFNGAHGQVTSTPVATGNPFLAVLQGSDTDCTATFSTGAS